MALLKSSKYDRFCPPAVNTVYNTIDMLSDYEIVDGITVKERGKIYRMPEILAIVEAL
ncbi:hypothetical protein [Halorubrum depositum]|uniref:Uncharacterized protein n=1 Tax=Halorubrum pallidum TaxID=1526114 RepID=A0ABD5T180_9EURY|nr:hypothetical protein [Halorubrum depositum]